VNGNSYSCEVTRNRRPGRRWIKSAVLTVAMFCFFWFDFFISLGSAGYRLLDFFAISMMALTILLLFNEPQPLPPHFRRGVKALLLLSLPILWGVFLSSVTTGVPLTRPAIGVLLGLGISLITIALAPSNFEVHSAAYVNLIIFAAAQIIQLLVFEIKGVQWSPVEMLGLEARLFALEFRPAGFFVEPAHQVLAVVLLSLLLASTGSFSRLASVLTVSSLLISKSLSGFFYLVIIFLALPEFRKQLLRPINMVLFVIVGCFFVSYALESTPSIFSRLSSLTSDGSFQHRFGGLDALNSNSGRDGTDQVLQGYGLVSEHRGAYGNNGLGFLLSAVGAPMSLIFISVIIWASRIGRAATIVFLFIVLTATPLFTLGIFWFLFGLVITNGLDIGRKNM